MTAIVDRVAGFVAAALDDGSDPFQIALDLDAAGLLADPCDRCGGDGTVAASTLYDEEQWTGLDCDVECPDCDGEGAAET